MKAVNVYLFQRVRNSSVTKRLAQFYEIFCTYRIKYALDINGPINKRNILL